jgi:hypothetical protein
MDDVKLEYLAEDVLDLDDVDEIQGRKSRKSKYGLVSARLEDIRFLTE